MDIVTLCEAGCFTSCATFCALQRVVFPKENLCISPKYVVVPFSKCHCPSYLVQSKLDKIHSLARRACGCLPYAIYNFPNVIVTKRWMIQISNPMLNENSKEPVCVLKSFKWSSYPTYFSEFQFFSDLHDRLRAIPLRSCFFSYWWLWETWCFCAMIGLWPHAPPASREEQAWHSLVVC